MKTLIIYHEIKPGVSCPDGIAAAWVAKKKFPHADLLGWSYGVEEPKIIGSYSRVVIVDFSFPLVVLEQWRQAGISVLVIDHHKTAMQDLSQFSNTIFNIESGEGLAVFDMQESGATLTWKTLFPNEPIPAYLQYVKDRDLWEFKLPLSEEIHEATSFCGRSLDKIEFYCSLNSTKLQNSLAQLGVYLLEPKRKRLKELAATAQTISVIGGYTAEFVELDSSEARLISDLCSTPQALAVTL